MKDLTDDARDEIMKSLFGSGEDSLKFTTARMSIASSDFGLDDSEATYVREHPAEFGLTQEKGRKLFASGMYSFSDTRDEAGKLLDVPDYDMNNFTTERDDYFTRPYIKAAIKFNPDIEIFGSPWSPPGWMKNNGKLNGSDGTNNTWGGNR